MTSWFRRESRKAGKELEAAGLAGVIDCSVCHGFTRKNLIQLHELERSYETCPGCYFLRCILTVLGRAGFNIPTGPWTPLLLTSWALWGTEHFLTIARCARQELEHWQVPTIQEEADFIEVFKIPGENCPWAKIPTAKLISGHTGSQICIDLLRTRLDYCVQKHSYCSQDSNVALPARVLHISATGGELAVRLVETNDNKGRYVCLSHRWIEGQTITTTTANIAQRRNGIPWNELPKTFQEAIVVVHALGLEYIWIDSLAINQDQSSGDWLVEAPKTAQYYQNALLTISAAEATKGLFYTFAGAPQVKLEVTPPEHFKQPNYNIFIRRPLSHDTSTLHHRAWVFQEHLLSPRIAHFGKELIWECAELTACECGRLPLSTKGGRRPLRDMWDIGNVVGTYGRKQGHMLALSSQHLESSFLLIPQPVFIRPDPNSPQNGLQISHWLLRQEQNQKVNSLVDDPAKAQVMVTDSQLHDELDEVTDRLVLLQTGGVRKERANERKIGTLSDSAEGDEHSKQEEAECDHVSASGSSDEEIRIYPTPLAHSRWLDVVAHYTRRKLTFGSDIFPALSGLAKQFHESSKCDYYAGLWEVTFAIDLLWRSCDPRNHSKPTEWRAPSWSWASTTAAVDYYHLLMSFELDTHTFRYSISHSFIDVIDVDCVPLEGNDMTMRLRSAKVTLLGTLFELDLGPVKGKTETPAAESSKTTAKEIESLKDIMEEAICLPEPSIPEEDIRYFPLARCMGSMEEVTHLIADTGLSFIRRKKEKELRQVLDVWWDSKEGADSLNMEAGTLQTYTCLLIARHESTMDTANFSLLLKPTSLAGTYERVGLLRHEMAIDTQNRTMITIV